MPVFGRRLLPAQASEVRLHDVTTGRDRLLLLSAEMVIEAPNWSRTARKLVVNAEGRLHWLTLPEGGDQGVLTVIDTGSIEHCNNDHLVSPDGAWHYLTADGAIWRCPAAGGEPVRVTPDPGTRPFRSYLHGISPDGQTLSFVGLEGALGGDGPIRTHNFLLDLATGIQTQLTDWDEACDGTEISPDGGHVYFNSERARRRPGHAQLFRLRRDGTRLEQLTFDDRVNWFPHPSPGGTRLLYLSYDERTEQHPANVPAQLRLLDLTDPTLGTPEHAPVVLREVFGGQGAMNVNPWIDDDRFAYVDYPIDADRAAQG